MTDAETTENLRELERLERRWDELVRELDALTIERRRLRGALYETVAESREDGGPQ
jgi:regulator of replication initiation timing